ncbi:tetratricopeptide repeat protein [Allosaccharopolyspora coralli]|uniref:Tetratricopeptide repeat protein n=1 Tax=Allosaccharopolyspora coralli TaxID=2665642 RepID=A0A5Q3Q6H5_9PSEU|nr:tetratricopeptide repeat protein [Allosaccharopolyspora coralli]QGK70251.1 tetratricopeptide repeat protein [Allosaccharopolyspora coralli]
MTTQRQRLEDFRNQVLRDIVELDRQVDEGEIPEATAERLRAEYENSAAEVLEALETLDDGAQRHGGSASKTAHRVVYVASGVAAVLAVGVFLPQFVADRPENGFVSGNEVNQSSSSPAPAPPRDLSTVTDEEMEQVIARNPEVVGMRLALAERYLEQGNYDKAAEHYGVALKQQPDNPKVLAESGRLLLAQGKPTEAAEFAARAQSIAPSSQNAQILHAETLAHRDAEGARKIVRALVRRTDLDPDVRPRAEALLLRLDPGRGGGR